MCFDPFVVRQIRVSVLEDERGDDTQTLSRGLTSGLRSVRVRHCPVKEDATGFRLPVNVVKETVSPPVY